MSKQARAETRDGRCARAQRAAAIAAACAGWLVVAAAAADPAPSARSGSAAAPSAQAGSAAQAGPSAQAGSRPETAHVLAFRRHLRGDKLRIALRDDAYLLLPNGARVTAERLAAARVWFEDTMPERLCEDGLAVHTLWRFEFDAQHRLVRRTHADYCGHPPDAAWR